MGTRKIYFFPASYIACQVLYPAFKYETPTLDRIAYTSCNEIDVRTVLGLFQF